MKMLKPALLAIALTALAAAPGASAQQPLKVKEGKAWKHKHSGIAVPATLGGNVRSRATAFAPEELDVGLQFDTDTSSEALSFYIYRNTNGNVALWFAQAQSAVESRDIFHKPALVGAVRSFTPPGQAAASGLAATYAPGSPSAYRSTGMMLLPVGQFYVKVRASSQSRSPVELAQWMDQVLASIDWPKAIAAAPAAVPVADCADKLAFDADAKDAPKDGAAALMSSFLSLAIADPKTAEETRPTGWCREAVVAPVQAVYRPDGDAARYLLAVGDNGNAVMVGPELAIAELADGKTDTAPRFSVSLVQADATVNYLAQDGLPTPERAVEVIRAGRKISRVPTWGDKRSIELNSDAM